MTPPTQPQAQRHPIFSDSFVTGANAIGITMTLTPIWRTRLFAGAGAVLAIVTGFLIASESLFWPGVCLACATALVLTRLQPLPLSTLVLGGAAFGYIVGNRGFAQLSLTRFFPLLPGEVALLVGGTALVVQSATKRHLPFRRDALNFAIFAWMLVGTIRFSFDFRDYGVLALRDFALVYYAGFFFFAQWSARDSASAKFLRHCLMLAIGLLLVVHPLYTQFTDFFVGTLQFRGTPLIFFKDDLVGNFMAMGALLFFLQFEQTRRLFWILPSMALTGLMLTTGSRSSMVGLGVGAAWLALAGRRRFAFTLAAGAIVMAVIVALVAEMRNRSIRQTPLWAVYERVVSVADPFGQRTYEVDEMSKGDNNVFRLVWWRAAIDETIETNSWFGLGFGYDLAARFVREYYPEGNDDFNARSPHNVLVTVFARMGALGFALFVFILIVTAIRTWHALRSARMVFTEGAWWCAVWVLFIGACFGVVLEGPMGAVVFWTALGLANATSVDALAVKEPAAEATAESPSADVAALPTAGGSA